MNILIINSVCGIRSTGRICLEMANYYEQQGNVVKIAYGRENASLDSLKYSVRIGSIADNYIHAFFSKLFFIDGRLSYTSTKNFLKWADSFNPDILWLHNIHGYYINYTLLFSWIKKRPNMKVFWLLHDCWAFTGGCSHFILSQCRNWKNNQCKKCHIPVSFTASSILKFSHINFKKKREMFLGVSNMTIITPSIWLSDLVKQSFLSCYPVVVKHNEIDLDIFHPVTTNLKRSLGLDGKKIVLGVQSGWSKSKGFYDFIKLSKMIVEPFIIILVGLTDKQKKEIPSNMIGFSRTNDVSQLVEFYSMADIFLNLTYEDNYPTVNLESQACGTVCLTYNTGGSPESVDPQNVVEPGDLNGIINRIYELCT